MANQCVFCMIIGGQIPSAKVYEDSLFLAFLDANPLNPGHTLVVPRQHFRWVWDVPNQAAYWTLAAKIANAMRRVLRTDWVISVVIGEAMHHAHIQLIPRFADDGHGGAINFAARKQVDKQQMIGIAEMLRNALQRG